MTKCTMRIVLILVLIASSSATMIRTSSLRVASIPVAQAPEVRPDLRDVLHVGGTTRRRLAAEVLGAIGGAAARDALTAALTSASDANVKRAIQTALGQLGQRPPRAEIR
jgi:HEAT repeat protein